MISPLFRLGIAACCMSVITGCHDDQDEIPPSAQPDLRRTVLIYVSAQNSLGYKNFHDKDSIEISEGAQYIRPEDCLLVYVDDESSPRIYKYSAQQKQPQIVKEWEEDLNSSSPATLQEVLSWTRENYAAQEFGLVMWSHSDGWIPSTNKTDEPEPSSPSTLSFGIDVGPDGSMKYDKDSNSRTGYQMDITDLANAVARSGIHLSYIFFDSCLMQCLEVAYDLRHITDYVIAGPMQIPGCGANYTHMLKKGLFTTAQEDIVSTYYNDANNGFDDIKDEYYDYGVVISSLRTDKMELLASTTARLLPFSQVKNRTSVNMSGVLNYQSYCRTYFYRPHLYDAQEAMKRVLSEVDYPIYEKALNDAIVSKSATPTFWIGPGNFTMQTVDPQHFCGVSTFIPQEVYTTNAEACPFGDLNEAFRQTAWYKAAGWQATGW